MFSKNVCANSTEHSTELTFMSRFIYTSTKINIYMFKVHNFNIKPKKSTFVKSTNVNMTGIHLKSNAMNIPIEIHPQYLLPIFSTVTK